MSKRQVFVNGNIYTADNKRRATAFVVEDDKFLYVGSDEAAKACARSGEDIHDLQEARVVPGMFDTHCHYVMMSGLGFASWLPIHFELSHEEVLALVKEYAEAHPDDTIIRGLGYGTDCRPLATELDKAVSDRPVFLMDASGHGAWVNTKMMELVGLDANIPDPKPGASFFVRDEEGNPTGHVVEAAAEVVVMRKAGISDSQNVKKELPETIKTMHSLGLVGFYDAGFLMLDEAEVLEVLSTLDLKAQIYTSFHFSGFRDNDEFLAEMIDLREKYSSSWLHPTTLKMFKDGTVEPRTAYLFEDYYPPAKGHGAEMHTPWEMLAMAQLAAVEGFNVHIHAVGDRAISETLDLYEALGETEGTKAIAHVTITPEDGPQRFADAGDVFYQTTPVWLFREASYDQVLGEVRSRQQTPLKTLADKGVRLIFGSDAPVSGGVLGMNPFMNMYCAIGRGFDNTMFYDPPSEGIDAATTLDAYTINAAHQLRAEESVGSITAGKQAHFVVLDRDVLAIDYEAIKDTKVLETWVDGERVYAAE